MQRRKLLISSTALVVIYISGCNRNQKEASKDIIMQKYSMKTLALGRYLIDIPSNINEKIIKCRYYGNEIEAKPFKSYSNVKDLVDNRISELKSLDISKNKFLKLINGNNSDSFILLYTEHPQDREIGGEIEGYLKLNDDKSYLFLKSGYAPEYESRAIPYTQNMFELLRPTAISPSDTFKGFAIDSAYIAESNPDKREYLQVNIKFNSDITLDFKTHVIGKVGDDPGLLERVNKAMLLEGVTSITSTSIVLRKTKRSIGDMNGEEFAYKTTKDSNDYRAFSFDWEFKGQPNNLAAPQFKLHMETGNDKYTDAELLGLWDAILGSLKLRPGAI